MRSRLDWPVARRAISSSWSPATGPVRRWLWRSRRRGVFHRQSPALLVDLGATQDWFADILDREDSDRIEIPGLADLLAERASFSEVIRRDLSTSLDVIPSGGIVGRGALDVIIPALASTYPRLVFHASDWRAAPARAAAEIADFVVIVASPARLRQTLEESRHELAAGGAELMGFAAHRSHPAFAEAA